MRRVESFPNLVAGSWLRLMTAGLALTLLAGVGVRADESREHARRERSHREAREREGLQVIARARLTRAQAERIARHHVPGGRIKEAELEMEDGVLQWTFDVAIPGSKLIADVEINAVTGKLLKLELEAPRHGREHSDMEAREREERHEREGVEAREREEYHEGREEHEREERMEKSHKRGHEKARVKEKEEDEEDED